MNDLSRESLLNILKSLQIIGYATTNENGELVELSLQNDYQDQTKVIPLFRFSSQVLPNISVVENEQRA